MYENAQNLGMYLKTTKMNIESKKNIKSKRERVYLEASYYRLLSSNLLAAKLPGESHSGTSYSPFWKKKEK